MRVVVYAVGVAEDNHVKVATATFPACGGSCEFLSDDLGAV